VFDPLFAPVWIAGICAPFALRDLRALRFIPIACALTAVAIVAGGGKDYYLAPIYPALFALGAVAVARVFRPLLVAWMVAAAGVAGVLAPLALPILDPPQLGAYMRALHLAPQAQERGDAGASLPPTFQDMLGWHVLVAQVARAYAEIPAADRPQTSILVDNYGEAAALDLYGPAYGLPPALSGQNQYGLWGPRGQSPRDILRVQDDPAKLAPYCGNVRVLGTTFAPNARGFENGKAIAFCRDLHPPIATLWPHLRFML
jgi:hypothetical protein